MTQNYQLTIGSRQRTDHAFNFQSPLFFFTLLFGTEAVAFQREFVVVRFGAVGQRTLAAGIAAQMIDGSVMSNLVNPGRELELGTITRQRTVDLDKNFLGQIERRFIVADHAVNVTGNRRLVTPHQFLKTTFDALRGTGHQIAIGSGAETK